MAGRDKGIIDPPIDALLEKVDSKYQLVIYASKRARQINDYYSDLHEGNLFDNVGPLVDSSVEDKPLTIALHEIYEDKLRLRHVDRFLRPPARDAVWHRSCPRLRDACSLGVGTRGHDCVGTRRTLRSVP